MATTCTEDGHRLPKQTLQYKPKGQRTQDDQERDGGTNFILRIKEQETRLILQEHEDDERKVYRRILDPAHDKENENERILTNKENYAMVKKPTVTENKVK